jgi:hypothetical protein
MMNVTREFKEAQEKGLTVMYHESACEYEVIYGDSSETFHEDDVNEMVKFIQEF